jgi:hypothetical protein
LSEVNETAKIEDAGNGDLRKGLAGPAKGSDGLWKKCTGFVYSYNVVTYTFPRVLFVYADTPRIRSIRSTETIAMAPGQVSISNAWLTHVGTAFTCIITNFDKTLREIILLSFRFQINKHYKRVQLTLRRNEMHRNARARNSTKNRCLCIIQLLIVIVLSYCLSTVLRVHESLSRGVEVVR